MCSMTYVFRELLPNDKQFSEQYARVRISQAPARSSVCDQSFIVEMVRPSRLWLRSTSKLVVKFVVLRGLFAFFGRLQEWGRLRRRIAAAWHTRTTVVLITFEQSQTDLTPGPGRLPSGDFAGQVRAPRLGQQAAWLVGPLPPSTSPCLARQAKHASGGSTRLAKNILLYRNSETAYV